MTATPPEPEWVSWDKARYRMLEIWRPWGDLWNEANEAMVSALRSGKVDCRCHYISSYDFRSVQLKEDILPTLERVTLGRDEAGVDWQVTFGSDGLWPSRQHIKSASARLLRPELVWGQFRDWLVYWKLPAVDGEVDDWHKAAWDSALAILENDERRPPLGRGRRKRLVEMVKGELGLKYGDSAVRKAIGRSLTEWERRNQK